MIALNTFTCHHLFIISLEIIRSTTALYRNTLSVWISVITNNTIAKCSIWVVNFKIPRALLYTFELLSVILFIRGTCNNRSITYLGLAVINLIWFANYLALTWRGVIKLFIRALLTFWNAFTGQIVEYVSTFTLNWTSNLDADVILSIIPGYCAITIVLTLFVLFVESLVVFTLIFEIRKGWRPTFFLGA